eukprot:g362.t1
MWFTRGNEEILGDDDYGVRSKKKEETKKQREKKKKMCLYDVKQCYRDDYEATGSTANILRINCEKEVYNGSTHTTAGDTTQAEEDGVDDTASRRKTSSSSPSKYRNGGKSPSFKHSFSEFMKAAKEIEKEEEVTKHVDESVKKEKMDVGEYSSAEDGVEEMHELLRKIAATKKKLGQEVDTTTTVNGVSSPSTNASSAATKEKEPSENQFIDLLYDASEKRRNGAKYLDTLRKPTDEDVLHPFDRHPTTPAKNTANDDVPSSLSSEHRRKPSFERISNWISGVFSASKDESADAADLTSNGDDVRAKNIISLLALGKDAPAKKIDATEKAMHDMSISPKYVRSSKNRCKYLRVAKHLVTKLLGAKHGTTAGRRHDAARGGDDKDSAIDWNLLDSEIRARFDDKYDKCLCSSCIGKKKATVTHGAVKCKGTPPRTYSRPDEWCHIGLHVDRRTYHEGKNIWRKWNVAFHGFPQKHIASIVVNGVAFPNDKIRVGKRFVRVRKPLGHSRDKIAQKNVFVSPSIGCAGCPLVYAIPVQIEHEGEKLWVQCALKLRIDPDCFTTRKNNIDPRLWPSDMPFDENISNSEIEWFTDARNCLVPTALMIRWSRENPRDDVTKRIAQWRATRDPQPDKRKMRRWFGFGKKRMTALKTKKTRKKDAKDAKPVDTNCGDALPSGSDIFFGVLRKRAERHLDGLLEKLKSRYASSQSNDSQQETFVADMCQLLGSKVLKEVIEEVEVTQMKDRRVGDAKKLASFSTASPPPASMIPKAAVGRDTVGPTSPRAKRNAQFASHGVGSNKPSKRLRSRRYRSAECPAEGTRPVADFVVEPIPRQRASSV